MTDSSHDPRTALVLGGGGATGNAWLIGVVAGMADAGVHVTTADLVVGTSAGATAAAMITAAAPADLYAGILRTVIPPRAGAAAARPVSDQLRRTSEIIAAATGPDDLRKRLGAWAIDQADAAGPEAQERWRATVASRLPSPDWPDRRILLTVVDADSGEPGVVDRDSGADLVDAVAASCSSGSAYRIGGRRFIDGGYRANADNPDVATGYGRILVLSPFGGRSRWPAEWGLDLDAQVQRLRAEGSRVEVVLGDSAALGENAMDYSARPSAAAGGLRQGDEASARVAELWG